MPLPAVTMWLALAAAVGCRSPPEPSIAPPPPGLAFAPAIVELAPALGQRQTADARLVGRLAAGAHLAIERVDDPALDVTLLPPDGGGAPGLRLTFTGDHAGVRTGQVVVATGGGEPARLTLLYSLRVRGNIVVDPSNPYFNLRDPDRRERRLLVRGRRPDFRVRAAQVLEGPFRASIESDGAATGGVATIRVRVDEPAVSGDQRGFLGKLRILGNDPAEPVTDVPLFAMGALNRHPPDTDAARRNAASTR